MTHNLLVLPQINLNGTSPDQLLEQQMEVNETLRAAIKAMVEATPNGRDFQLRPAEHKAALTAWHDRCEVLSRMLAEMEQFGFELASAADAYKERRP